MQELNRRNTETVELALKDMNARLYDMQKRNEAQHLSLVNLTERLNALEQTLHIQKARLTGLGPSVKSKEDNAGQ